MDYKRYGKRFNWRLDARYSIHDNHGFLVSFGMASRSEAKNKLRELGDGFWLKDNINTTFLYLVRFSKVKKVRVDLPASQALFNIIPIP